MARDFTAGSEAAEAVAHLVSLLRDFETATLITRSRGGSLQGRPTSIARVDDNATVWLVTSASAIAAQELVDDARAMLTLQASLRFVSINGRVDLMASPADLSALGEQSYRVWHDGESAPEVALLRFTAFDAEYWDDSSARSSRYVFRADVARGSTANAARAPDAHARLLLWSGESS